MTPLGAGEADPLRPSPPVHIAPRPNATVTENGNGQQHDAEAWMPFTCQSCTRRKIKCDKLKDVCSSCRKAGLTCVYLAPPPRQRKRKRHEGIQEKLARYEKTLKENDLLEASQATVSGTNEHTQQDSPVTSIESGSDSQRYQGKVVTRPEKVRYISSSLWDSLQDEDLESDSDEDDVVVPSPHKVNIIPDDPLSTGLLYQSQDLLLSHPNVEDAAKLWLAYTDNVDPLLKLMHNPTLEKIVINVYQNPVRASRAHECLVFSIYHAAVTSLSDEQCRSFFDQSRSVLLSRYRFATHQALINAGWLRTTDVTVVQALVLLLIIVRFHSDVHTFWILTGVALRIAQRIGLHRESANNNLRPFDAEMRRRLFWHLVPLDGYASGMSGTGISLSPTGWDTQKPANIDDAQLWPEMTVPPTPQIGATDMLFCLAKAELVDHYTRRGVQAGQVDDGTLRPKDDKTIENLINETENAMEEKYLRYCDILNPVHMLALGMVRSAMNAARLQRRIPHLMNKTANDADRMDLCILSQKIIDTLDMTHGNPRMQNYLWLTKAFNLWPALACLLTSLLKPNFFSAEQRDAIWKRISNVFAHHADMLKRKSALTSSIGRLVLQAWDANPPSDSAAEPGYVATLRAKRKRKGISDGKRDVETSGRGINTSSSSIERENVCTTSETGALIQDETIPLDWQDFSIDVGDWAFWDNLIREYQSMPGE